MELVGHSPWLGIGLSAFGSVYPLVRTVQSSVTYTHAESDVVQLLADTGLIGALLCTAALVAVGATLLRRPASAGGTTSGLRLAGAAALCGVVLAGVGNFTMPVMAGVLYLVVAMLLSGASEPRAFSAETS
jgi:O-antigen ligase